MRARIPAGIDLEDKLLYGLSPARLGYVTALVGGAIWVLRQPLPGPLRWFCTAALLAAAAAVGWLSKGGRHLDAWAADLARHVTRRYRLVADLGPLGRFASQAVQRWRPPLHQRIRLQRFSLPLRLPRARRT